MELLGADPKQKMKRKEFELDGRVKFQQESQSRRFGSGSTGENLIHVFDPLETLMVVVLEFLLSNSMIFPIDSTAFLQLMGQNSDFVTLYTRAGLKIFEDFLVSFYKKIDDPKALVMENICGISLRRWVILGIDRTRLFQFYQKSKCQLHKTNLIQTASDDTTLAEFYPLRISTQKISDYSIQNLHFSWEALLSQPTYQQRSEEKEGLEVLELLSSPSITEQQALTKV